MNDCLGAWSGTGNLGSVVRILPHVRQCRSTRECGGKREATSLGFVVPSDRKPAEIAMPEDRVIVPNELKGEVLEVLDRELGTSLDPPTTRAHFIADGPPLFFVHAIHIKNGNCASFRVGHETTGFHAPLLRSEVGTLEKESREFGQSVPSRPCG